MLKTPIAVLDRNGNIGAAPATVKLNAVAACPGIKFIDQIQVFRRRDVAALLDDHLKGMPLALYHHRNNRAARRKAAHAKFLLPAIADGFLRAKHSHRRV